MGWITLDTLLHDVLMHEQAAAITQEFGYKTIRDLIVHYPRRYESRGALTRIEQLPLGEHVTLMADVVRMSVRSMERRKGTITEAIISDGYGQVSITWFNQHWRKKYIKPGMRGLFAGKITSYRGKYQLTHPECYIFTEEAEGEGFNQQIANVDRFRAQVLPIYPATQNVSSWTLLDAIDTVLKRIGEIEDPLPGSVRKEAYEFYRHELRNTQSEYEGMILSLTTALTNMHKPENLTLQREAEYSLLFREAFELQLGLLDRKRHSTTHLTHQWPVNPAGLLADFDSKLPFTLTEDQLAVGETIQRELARGTPMHRLLQGEVASGKTLVALRAMLQIADEGGQSALLAPTEVLASQHLRSITELLGEELTKQLHPTLLTGQMPAAQRREALLDIASGKARIVIGTHALMSDTTTFNLLGLVVVDEQHRFGVSQRDALRKKASLPPHLLVMTATPIPRTIALTAFGDLDVSVITQLPPGRLGIVSHVVALAERPRWRDRMWERAGEEIREGRQVYVVCPAISPEETPPTKPEATTDSDSDTQRKPLANVEETIAEIRAHPALHHARVAMLTGEMGAEDKDSVMRAFQAGDIDVLVATTVIEVGVNVPNATVMIVRDADRFGISQLHQLRGRVGRGSHAGLCLLETTAPLGSGARERVETVAASNDGFALADYDLEQRREGDLLGEQQSGGHSTLNLLRVTKHGPLIQLARLSAEGFLARHPDLRSFPLLEDLIRRGREAHLDKLGKS